MENATKALIIAGSLLISLVVISMVVLVINSLTNYQDVNSASKEVDLLAAFNAEYEAYNRKDVRGNELVTLANKVVDYNRRKTTKISDTNYDVGDTIGYKPIELTIDLNRHANVFAYDNANKLFTSGTYNSDNLNNIINTVQNLEQYFPKDSLESLSANISGIYLDNYKNNGNANVNNSDDRKNMLSSIRKVNDCFGVEVIEISENASERFTLIEDGWNWIWERNSTGKHIKGKYITNLKSSIYKYYEFVQFKRGRFECTKTERDSDTGRITKMEFKFSGYLK